MFDEEIEKVMGEELDKSVSNISEIRDGTNTSFIVTCNGEKFFFKIGDFDPESVKVEPYFFDLMNENDIRTPEVYWRGKVNVYPSFIAEYFDGDTPGYPQDLSDSDILKYSKDVGKVLGKIQRIEKPAGEFSVSNGQLQVINGGWGNLFYYLLERFSFQAKGNFSQIGSEANRIAHKAGFPNLNEKSSLCPLDLHTANLFYSSSGNLQGVVDMERVYSGHSRLAYEINLQSLYADRESMEGQIRQKFKNGYSNSRPIPEYHPVFEVLAVLREMRAAHIWWGDKSRRKKALRNKLEEIEKKI